MRDVRCRFINHTMALLFGALLFVLVPGVVSAQQKPRDKKPDKPAANKSLENRKTPSGMNIAREAAALAFVHEHHPELESLLASLKARQPKQYEAAIRDLFRHSERLAGFQEKDSARYELELKAWKLQSRVQLLSATVLMSPQDEAAKSKLKETLVEQLHARRELLAHERDQAAKRLKKLDAQLEKLDREAESTAEAQLQTILAGPRSKGKASLKPPAQSANSTAVNPSR